MDKVQEYQRGYAAGRRKHERDIKALKKQVSELSFKSNERQERIFMQCLEMTLKHCDGWTIGGAKIDNAERYCRLAKVFADNAISELGK